VQEVMKFLIPIRTKPLKSCLKMVAALLGIFVVVGLQPASADDTPKDQEIREFQDCENCPVMVVVPKGEFKMGARPYDKTARDAEKPPIPINLTYKFAVGKFEVTHEQFMACVEAGGCSHTPEPTVKKHPAIQPVVDINRYDAEEYVIWLTKKTGRPYRLLSEVEWEYAARSGTDTIYWWGDNVGIGNAVCMGCGHARVTEKYWFFGEPSPVGSLKPNPFGIYDMAGNVSEWVKDCWFPQLLKSVIAKSNTVSEMQCREGTIRGASINMPVRFTRLSHRSPTKPEYRGKSVGMRVAAKVE